MRLTKVSVGSLTKGQEFGFILSVMGAWGQGGGGECLSQQGNGLI